MQRRKQLRCSQSIPPCKLQLYLDQHAAWVKRSETQGGERVTWHEQEGRIKVTVTDIGEIEVGGEYGDE